MMKQTKPKFGIGQGVVTRSGEKGVIKKIGRPGGDAYDPKKRHPLGRWQYALSGTTVRWHIEGDLRLWTKADFIVKREPRRNVYVVSRGHWAKIEWSIPSDGLAMIGSVVAVFKRWAKAERYCNDWRFKEAENWLRAVAIDKKQKEATFPPFTISKEIKNSKGLTYIMWSNGVAWIEMRQQRVRP